MSQQLEHSETESRQTILSGRFALALLALAIAFGIAYTQNPLYTGNQNSYFLHGLKSSGLGFLSNDWMGNTVDPFPLFSWLVNFTVTALTPSAFYLYHALLLGIYFFACLGIASKTFRLNASGSQFLFPALLVTGLHSAGLADIATAITGMNPVWMVELGLAQQSIIGHELVPATFGVFLPLSIYAFLSEKPFLAVACSAIAAAFHGSYLPSALLLTIIYAGVILIRERNRRRALLTGVLGLALLMPALLHIYSSFSPTSPALFAQSQNILAQFRMPHHTVPGIWFNKQAAGVLLVILAGLFLARNKKVFSVLLIPSLVGLILTLVQVFWPSDALALLFPWRLSAWLLPVSWAVIVGALTSALTGTSAQQGVLLIGSRNTASVRKRPSSDDPGLKEMVGSNPEIRKASRGYDLALLSGIVLFALYGGWKMYHAFQVQPSRADVEGMMQFVSQNAAPNQTYLVPLHLDRFRLRTGVPILVDWKTHPYKDREVVEWYERLHMAERFYRAKADSTRHILHEIRERYGITHVVLPAGAAAVRSTDMLEVYANPKYEVYQMSEGSTPRQALSPLARTP